MLDLNPNERVLLTVRRHWWVMVRPILLLFLLLLLPSVGVSLAAIYLPGAIADVALGNLLLLLYLLGLLLFAFIIWTNYYLDVWIITNERIIDVQQKNLFSRVISEFAMNRVQNVSIEVHGVVETLLKFGDLKVETAGHGGGFTIQDAPNLYQAKDLILRYSSAAASQT